MVYLDDALGNQIEDEKNYYQYNDYIGKSLDYTIIISEDLTTNCNNDLCSLCFNNYSCIICSYNYTFNDNKKTCFPNIESTTIITTIPATIITTIPTNILTTIPTTILTTIPTSIISTIPTTILTTIPTTILTTIPTSIISTIPISILTTIPTYYITTIPTSIISIIPTTYLTKISASILTTLPTTYLTTLSTTILKAITIATLKTTFDTVNLFTDDCSVKGIIENKCDEVITNEQIIQVSDKLKEKISPDSNVIIGTKNVNFQISSLEIQKNNDYLNISSIDLGKCEDILKEQEGLSEEEDLIIFKIDIKSEDLSQIYVLYEIYSPLTLERIDVEACKNISIGVTVPVNLDENTKNIYYSLNKSGYNLFDLNDPFYNDICSTYTTRDGTDLTLIDRKNLIYDKNGNNTLCQIGCEFKFYNLTNGKAKCVCDVQIEESNKIVDIFKFSLDQINNSFYKTLTNSNFLVLKCYKLVFSKKGQANNIGSYLLSGLTFIFIILIILYIINGNKKIDFFIQSIVNFKLHYKSSHRINSSKSLKKKKEEKIKENKINIIKDKNQKNSGKKRSKSFKMYGKNNIIKNLKYPPKKLKLGKINKSSSNGLNRPSYKSFSSLNRKSGIFDKQKKSKINKKNNKQNKEEYLDKYKIKELNDEELNNLEYKDALIMDKRTFCQYYFSLLKKKNLIIFTFYPSNDYNLMTVKIALFLLSFSLFFTINGFFFSDATMNKINEDKGTYNFLNQIPQILYSTIISSIINMILKLLSLSEKQILIIKSQTNYKDARDKSNNIRRCLRIKMITFSLLSLILMSFFW